MPYNPQIVATQSNRLEGNSPQKLAAKKVAAQQLSSMPTENNSKFEMSLIISKWRGNVLDLFVYKLPFTVDRIFNYSVLGVFFFLVGGGISFRTCPQHHLASLHATELILNMSRAK